MNIARINGSAAPDDFDVSFVAGSVQIDVNGVSARIRLAGISRLELNTLAGNDQVRIGDLSGIGPANRDLFGAKSDVLRCVQT